MNLDIEEVCNSIKNYQTSDMFNEEILNYFKDIYDTIEEIRVLDDFPDSPDYLKKELLQVFEDAISERFRIIQAKIPERLRVAVKTKLLKMVDETLEGIIMVSDISNETWNE